MSDKSALLTKYKYLYAKNPRSKVFAPLAESYRKLGLIQEALKVLQDGIRLHPSYPLGYIVLGNVYYDQADYQLAYSTVRSFVKNNLENLALQKLFSRICLKLGYFDEALETFKYLLLINPNDKYAIEKVNELEEKLEVKDIVDEEIRYESYDVEDDWTQVDFTSNIKAKRSAAEIGPVDEWEVQSPISAVADTTDGILEKVEVSEYDLDSEFFQEDYDNDSEDVILPEEDFEDSKVEKAPVSMMLVDLYCEQGHFDHALDMLEEAIRLNPDNEAIKDKHAQVLEQKSEEDDLDSLVVEVQADKELESQIRVLDDFLKEIQDHATRRNYENSGVEWRKS